MSAIVETDVLIIGTGFAGLGLGIRLRQAGQHDFVILEQADELGGTWRDNHYPGVACDVPAPLYSYSFEPNPRWSGLFAEQREILAYLNHCADKYGVRSHIRFGSEVVRARFDETLSRWEISTAHGRVYHARVLVAATGGLSRPSYPDIPGLDQFRGKMFHTARWDDAYPLEGKTVAVIGTGASAIQVVPSIVARVQRLKLFQRTPAWVVPRPEVKFGEHAKQRFTRFPWLLLFVRRLIYWMFEIRVLGFSGIVPALQRAAEQRAREYLDEEVRDPELRARLTPNYRLGCKRMLVASDYYAALQRDNAELVCEGIREIRPTGIVTQDGREHAVDAIVLATGFQTAEYAAPFDVIGRGGQSLNATWHDGAEAYLGATIAGFPNYFMLIGPNTGLGHSSMVFMIESQLRYVMDCLRTMRERGLAWVEIKQRVQQAYNRRLTKRFERTVWHTGGCVSWYRTRTGKNTTLWPGFTFEFRWRTRRFDLESYLQLDQRSAADRARRAPASLRAPSLEGGEQRAPA